MKRVVVKRKYTESYPEKKVNKNAKLRNLVLDLVTRNSDLTLEELTSHLSKHTKNPSKAIKRYCNWITVSERDGTKYVTLSKRGAKLYDSLQANKTKSEFIPTFEQFSNGDDLTAGLQESAIVDSEFLVEHEHDLDILDGCSPLNESVNLPTTKAEVSQLIFETNTKIQEYLIENGYNDEILSDFIDIKEMLEEIKSKL